MSCSLLLLRPKSIVSARPSLQTPSASMQVVELNVGGHCFTTLRSTLCKHEDSMLCKMFSGDLAPAQQDSQGRFFIDRDGTHFASVLAYLRGQPMQFPSNFTERSALAVEASFYQLQGLQDMLTMGYAEATDNSSSEPMFEDLGRLHIKEGEALLLQHARSCVGQTKINRICEALARFHFGERGQGFNSRATSHQKLGSLAVNAKQTSAFGFYKEHVGYGGSCARYPWSAFKGPDGYSGPWKLSRMTESPLLEDIDADELVHLLYTYAVLFQSEMELRGFQLKLLPEGPTRSYTFEYDGEALRFSVTVTAVQHLSQ